MRIHVVAAGYVIAFSFMLETTRSEKAILLLAVSQVICAEMLNTSIEKFCDFSQEKFSIKIEVIKDIAAGAVLVSVLFAVGAGLFIFVRPEFVRLLYRLATTPVYLVVALVCTGAAVYFIKSSPGEAWREGKNNK